MYKCCNGFYSFSAEPSLLSQTKVKLLIQDGVDVNRKLPSSCPLVGKSLLYAAALLDNYEAVEILLEKRD